MNQRLIGIILGLAIISLVIVAIFRSNFLMAGMAVALFYLAPTAGRPSWWWMASIATLGSGITMGLPGDANLHLLVILGFLVLMIIRLSILRGRDTAPSVPRKACIALLFIIVLTASYRGWGFKILDSTFWGGMQYVSLIAALLFYIYSSRVAVSWPQFGGMLRWFFLLSLLPAIALLIAHSLPAGEWINNIIAIGENETETAGVQWQAPEVSRWAFMQYPAIWMGVLGLFLYDRRFKFTPFMILVSVLSFIMLGLSGHRTVVVLLGLTTLVYMAIRRRSVRWSQFLKLSGVLVLLIAMIYLSAGQLPLAFQRAFAWLPGIQVSYEAGIDASNTSEWRITLWKPLLEMVPDYLWMGRGMAFSINDANAASALVSDRETKHIFFTVVHLYHNGPLWFLLDLGLAGLVAGLFFMVGGIMHYGRQLHRIPDGSLWKTAYVVFYSFFVGYCLFFFTVIGGGTFLCHILIVAAMLEVIVRSVEAEAEQEASG
ncbi:MAG: O-antigen ligase family protein [bacterium]